MRTIYQPKGKAQEYAESRKGAGDGWAVNLYKGCQHNCIYCYVPGQPPWKFSKTAKADFHGQVRAREGILPALAKEAAKRKGFPWPLHLCFTCDPWPRTKDPEFVSVTSEALEILARNEFQNVQVLTKGGTLAEPDLDIIQANGWKFGQTIVHRDYKRIEPGAASYLKRVEMLQRAHRMGIFTWISLEPVVDVVEAYKIIADLQDYVDLWKIGKLNYGKDISPEYEAFERDTDWKKFIRVVRFLLKDCNYMLKDSLLDFGEEKACSECMLVTAGVRDVCQYHDSVI